MKLSADLIAKLVGEEAIDDSTMRLASQFCGLVLEANRKINLVSRAGDVAAEITRQFALSIAVIPRLPRPGTVRWLDIGSGGGFPAVPIAVFRPQDSFNLVESVAKKAFFLERTAETLGLANVRVVNQRADEYLGDGLAELERFNVMSIKAVADWRETISWADRALLPGGILITYKPLDQTPNGDQTIQKSSFELIGSFTIADLAPEITTRIMMFRKSA